MSHPYLTFPTIPYFIRDAPHTMRLSSSSWRVSLMRYFTTYIPYRTFLFVLSVSFLHTRVMFLFVPLWLAFPFIYSTTFYSTLLYIPCIFHTFYASSVDALLPRSDLRDFDTPTTRPGYRHLAIRPTFDLRHLDIYLPTRLSSPIIPPFLLPSDIADEFLDSFIDDLLTILPDSSTAIDTVLGEVSRIGHTVGRPYNLCHTGASVLQFKEICQLRIY